MLRAAIAVLIVSGAVADDASCAMQVAKGGKVSFNSEVVNVSFSEVPEYAGKYCYNVENEERADYRAFSGVASRQECQDECAADPFCNFYGWYKVGSRCDDCVLYKSCDARRESVCNDVDDPKIYAKSPPNTKKKEVKGFEVQVMLTGMYCKGSELKAMEHATLEECKSYCSQFSRCQYFGYYHSAEPREDASSSSCSASCRLFSSCNGTVIESLCKPGPVVFGTTTVTTAAPGPTTTSRTTTTTTTTPTTTTAAATTTFAGVSGDFTLTSDQVGVQNGAGHIYQIHDQIVTITFKKDVVIGPGPSYGYVRAKMPQDLALRPDMQNTGFPSYDAYKPGFKCHWAAGNQNAVWFKYEDPPRGSNVWVIDMTKVTIPSGTTCTYPVAASSP
ncbi:unnamed protein product [Effrenium voratum]|nr:unnamed protein product [Effrenium voratum]